MSTNNGVSDKSSSLASENTYPDLPGNTGNQECSWQGAGICIVTQEILGPTRNGGIATAYTSLAVALANSGCEVTILYVKDRGYDDHDFLYWEKEYSRQNITFLELPEYEEYIVDAPHHAVRSFSAMHWLRQNEDKFSIVHFPDWWGLGYYSTLLKHTGLALQHIKFVIGTHGPTVFGLESNLDPLHDLTLLEQDFMERESIRLADVVIGPSRFLLNWLKNRDWKFPPDTYIASYVLPKHLRNVPSDNVYLPVRGLAFFGRLEERKGLALFCDAIDRLPMRDDPSFHVSFVGKGIFIRGTTSKNYIKGRARKWGCRVSIETNLDRDGAVNYLRQSGRLAIIPSFMENSPNTVLECIAAGIPFLASSIGGIPELIAPECRREICFTPRPAVLAETMVRALQNGARIARPAVDFEENEKRWIAWHKNISSQQTPLPPPVKNDPMPLVSVVIAYFNRPQYLREALDSLEKQEYKNFEVVIVDGGSTLPAAVEFLNSLAPYFQAKGWKIVRDDDRLTGAARNTGVRHAHGEYVMFMDDDNYAKPEEIKIFVSVAQKTGADIVTCASQVFFSSEIPDPNRKGISPDGKGVKMWLPLGPAAAAGIFRNVFGDSNAFIKKEVFESLGGFIEDFYPAHDDWEFFARAVLNKYKLVLIPEPLFLYRIHEGASSNPASGVKIDLLRHIRPYAALLRGEMGGLASLAMGLFVGKTGSATAFPIIPPQAILDRYWDSASWQSTKMFRYFVNLVLGRPSEKRPVAKSYPQANQMVFEIVNSTSWSLASPVRFFCSLLIKPGNEAEQE